MLAKTRDFLNDVKSELNKVTWPGRKETISTAWVVIVIIVLVSLYLGVCDLILAKLIRTLIR